jgi:hypothetical protein
MIHNLFIKRKNKKEQTKIKKQKQEQKQKKMNSSSESCVIICFNDEITSSEMIRTLMIKRKVLEDIENKYSLIKPNNYQFIDRQIVCTECDEKIYRFEIFNLEFGDY